MAEGGEEIETITIPDDPDDDWPSGGPQDLREVEAYAEKVNQIFEDLGELLHKDNKDTLPSTILQVEEAHGASLGADEKCRCGHSGQGNKRPSLPPSQAAFDPQRCGSPGAGHRGAHQLGVFVQQLPEEKERRGGACIDHLYL